MITNVLIIIIFYCSFLVLTTKNGVMDHEEAKRRNLGGKILGFFF